MLRNIAKLTRLPKGLIAFKPQALPNFTLHFNPVNNFSSDQPPKGPYSHQKISLMRILSRFRKILEKKIKAF